MYFRQTQDFHFSSLDIVCGDYEQMNDGTVSETFLICESSQVTRGVYQLLRVLSFVSAALLMVTLAAILGSSRMRTTAHGWALACHASCLLAFNLGQVAYFVGFGDGDEFDFREAGTQIPKECYIIGLILYFCLTAASSWLTAVCVNMLLGFRRLRVARSGGSAELRRFAAFSVFAWGFPTILTIVSGLAFKKVPWPLTPSFMETRTCFHGTGKRAWMYNPDQKYQIAKTGTAIFYYIPVFTLVLVNAVCLGLTLKKVQFLRKGNSVLRRDEGLAQTEAGDCIYEEAGGNSCTALIPKDKGRRRGGKRRGKGAAPGAHRVTMYIKLLLMAGAIEFVAEALVWICTPFIVDASEDRPTNTLYHMNNNKFAYRAAGYACDFFRAVCVAWLAAPDGGYWAAIMGRMCLEIRKRMSHNPQEGSRGERKAKAK